MIVVNKNGEVTCPNCNKVYFAQLSQREDWPERYARLQTELVHQVFPKAMAYQKEQLITGICNDRCWHEYLDLGLDE